MVLPHEAAKVDLGVGADQVDVELEESTQVFASIHFSELQNFGARGSEHRDRPAHGAFRPDKRKSEGTGSQAEVSWEVNRLAAQFGVMSPCRPAHGNVA
ncbi:MAG: hypothetical protein ACOC1F_07535 [Myxococcota bacterium]